MVGFRISENPVGWGEEEGAHGMRVGITEVFSYDDSWGIGFFWVARFHLRRYLLGGLLSPRLFLDCVVQ